MYAALATTEWAKTQYYKKIMIIGIDASRVAKEEKTGTENYSWNLIKAIAKIDTQNRYVLYFDKIPQFFEINQPNFSTKVIRMPRFWTQLGLAFECLVNPPDILFVPAHTIPIIRRPGLKTTVTIHDLGAEFLAAYHHFPQKLYLNWATNFAARNATGVIAVSKATKKDLLKNYKIPSDRIYVVYEGLDQELFYRPDEQVIDQVRAKYGLSRNYFLFVGTIQPRKNLTRLIEAFAKLNSKNYELVLVGARGWLADEIYEAPNRLNLQDRVRFLGFVSNEDLPAFYSGALAFVFPSLYEGFGLPILEAFACGCPIITSKKGATEEIANGAAILVDPENVDDIAFALKNLAKNDKLRKDLIEKGQIRVRQFSWEKTAKETIKVFEKVYNQRASP